MPDLITLGQKTHYKDDCFVAPFEPTPQTILIQHGYGRSSNFWYEWVPLLSSKYRVIRRDLRGHGESSAPNRDTYDWSLDTMLAEIIDMLDQLGLQKVHFLGESTSGMLGMALAAKYPDRLHSLIICSSPTHLPSATVKFLSMGYDTWQEAVRTLGSEGWARALSKLPGTGGRKDPVFFEWWAKEIGKSPSYGLEQYSKFLESLDGRPFLKDITIPTLILAPKKSSAAPIAYAPFEYF
jgi:pimeloyl-ACP methyl ester carboxylesterase